MKVRWPLITLFFIGLAMAVIPFYKVTHVKIAVPVTLEITAIEESLPSMDILLPLQNKSQVKQFMLSDATDQHPYTDSYQCGSFARAVVHNASIRGLEAYVISLLLDGSSVLHAIVQFPTVDDGDIYVDATSGDWWVDFDMVPSRYCSYSMLNESQYGFYGKSIVFYSVHNSDGSRTIIANERYSYPTPTPTPSSSPTPSPIPTASPAPTYLPTPCFVCNGCSQDIQAWPTMLLVNGNIMSHWKCPNARLFKNRAEIEAFMLWDTTYIENGNCASYTEAIVKHAAECGYQAGIGCVAFEGYQYHSFVAFQIEENSETVWVDATMGDWWIEVTDDGYWNAVSMTDPNYWYFGDIPRKMSYMHSLDY